MLCACAVRAKGGEATGQDDGTAMDEDEEVLHPVVCDGCGTMVGVQDSDEVVHFHNVLES